MRTCNWTLDFLIRNSVSIAEARLMTDAPISLIAGKNGCGKSQLLNILSSRFNTGGHNLKTLGYRSYFPNEKTQVSISGPKHVYIVHSTRTIGKDRDERVAGPYTFAQLKKMAFGERYMKFRKALSKLAFEAQCYAEGESAAANQVVKTRRKWALDTIIKQFCKLFPTLSLSFEVDEREGVVRLFAERMNMPFVRATSESTSDALSFPFATLSDGEINTLFLLYEVIYRASVDSDPALYLIDEIENHLHPSLLSSFIHTLQEVLPAHAMIIATTHSPQLIGSVDPNSRILMIHSSEMHAQKLSNQLRVSSDDAGANRLLYDLYGADSAGVAAQFLRSMAQAAGGEVLMFAQESLRDAHAFAGSSPADPQRTFLAGLIHGRHVSGRSLEVLDVGGGQGRLIAGLREDLKSSSGARIVIDVVDPNPNYRQTLRKLSEGEQGNVSLKDIYVSIMDVDGSVKYDYIMFSNVIHEISRSDFVATIECAINHLREGGAINVMEQEVLPQGEKYYFVFEPNALCELFTSIGCTSTLSARRSRSGVPIYELTAVKTSVIDLERSAFAELIGIAVDQTVERSIQAYENTLNKPDKPTELAFHAINIANGALLKRALLSKPANDG